MKGILRTSLLFLAVLANAAIAQELPCVDPCEGGEGGGSCTNTELTGTERYSYSAVFPPGIFMACYELGRRIQVVCRDEDGNVLSDVTVVYWTGELRCRSGG